MVSDNVDEVVSSVAVLEDLLHMIDIDIAIFEAGIKTQSAQHQKTMDVMVSGMAKLAKLVEDVNALARHSVQLDTKFERLVELTTTRQVQLFQPSSALEKLAHSHLQDDLKGLGTV